MPALSPFLIFREQSWVSFSSCVTGVPCGMAAQREYILGAECQQEGHIKKSLIRMGHLWSSALWQIHISYTFSTRHKYLGSCLKKKKGRKNEHSCGRFCSFPTDLPPQTIRKSRSNALSCWPSYPTLTRLRLVHKN